MNTRQFKVKRNKIVKAIKPWVFPIIGLVVLLVAFAIVGTMEFNTEQAKIKQTDRETYSGRVDATFAVNTFSSEEQYTTHSI